MSFDGFHSSEPVTSIQIEQSIDGEANLFNKIGKNVELLHSPEERIIEQLENRQDRAEKLVNFSITERIMEVHTAELINRKQELNEMPSWHNSEMMIAYPNFNLKIDGWQVV